MAVNIPQFAWFLACCSLALGESYTVAERRHWSLRPRATPAVPSLAAHPIDAFILAKLKEQGLTMSPPASRQALIRRVTFDLTGLPPTPDAVRAFVADRSPQAYEQLVDRLLASPEYAERQARQWLDVVRFAESDGFEYDTHRSEAWRYRDYVIRSFAEDKPYDRFVTEQLAGDELAPGDLEMQVAASFNRLGPYRRNAGNQDKAYIRNEILTEMTNVVGSAFLGVTLGCARCHDHKFDPIRHTDYYRLQSFFATTEQHDIPMSTEAEKAAWKERTAAVNQELAALKKRLKEAAPADKAAIEQRIGVKEKQVPEPLPELKTVRDDPALYQPVHVLLRGSSDAPAAKVGMRPLGVLLPDEAPEWGDALAQPRLKLARWIVDPANPLTARVLVNRLWMGHFGAGIVATPSDFGRMGARPTHPELLDWLANEFVAGGFRIKPIHRLMVLSQTYQQASRTTPAGRDKDPRNRFLWTYSRRRLQAEEMRDAMLSAAGILNPRRGGPGVITPIEPELVNLLYKPDQWAVTPDAAEHNRRSIYLFQKRNMRMPFMEVFDAPDTLLSCARRESSTHAPQALELLNGPVTRQASVALAERLEKLAPAQRILQAFEAVFGRPPVAKERAAAEKFLASSPLREFALALFAANDFLYVQ
ncbi:MAG: DUF1549 and DUF1553 domain-containing protein [Bryobacteraceae bacterium]|nr:DUF1549 and DUF1553 domain-containing protein [Bryobacteraceae bacterium]